MTTADRKLIDEAIEHHETNSWQASSTKCIIDDLLEFLAKDSLDLKVIRKED